MRLSLFILTNLFLASSAFAFVPTTNDVGAEVTTYEKLLQNDDGSYTIMKPFFGSSDGDNKSFSSQTDLLGLCKFFGFQKYVSNSALASGDLNGSAVILDRDSHFQSFRGYSSTGYNNSTVDSIVCSSDQPTLPRASQRATIVSSGDGSIVTVKNPRIGYFDGQVRAISATSNSDGVCRLFGFTTAVPNSVFTSGDNHDHTIILNGDAHFSGFRSHSSSGYNNNWIDSLMCTGNVGFQAVPAEFRLERLGSGFESVAGLSHGSRKTFFHDLSGALDQFLPSLPQGMTPDGIRYQSRLFALLAARPVVKAGSSQIYVQNVIPAYETALTQYGVSALTDLEATKETFLAAAMVLNSVFTATAAETASDTERQLIKAQGVQTGLLIANGAKLSAVVAFLAQSRVMNTVVAGWLEAPEMKAYAITYQSLITYLQVKTQ